MVWKEKCAFPGQDSADLMEWGARVEGDGEGVEESGDDDDEEEDEEEVVE